MNKPTQNIDGIIVYHEAKIEPRLIKSFFHRYGKLKNVPFMNKERAGSKILSSCIIFQEEGSLKNLMSIYHNSDFKINDVKVLISIGCKRVNPVKSEIFVKQSLFLNDYDLLKYFLETLSRYPECRDIKANYLKEKKEVIFKFSTHLPKHFLNQNHIILRKDSQQYCLNMKMFNFYEKIEKKKSSNEPPTVMKYKKSRRTYCFRTVGITYTVNDTADRNRFNGVDVLNKEEKILKMFGKYGDIENHSTFYFGENVKKTTITYSSCSSVVKIFEDKFNYGNFLRRTSTKLRNPHEPQRGNRPNKLNNPELYSPGKLTKYLLVENISMDVGHTLHFDEIQTIVRVSKNHMVSEFELVQFFDGFYSSFNYFNDFKDYYIFIFKKYVNIRNPGEIWHKSSGNGQKPEKRTFTITPIDLNYLLNAFISLKEKENGNLKVKEIYKRRSRIFCRYRDPKREVSVISYNILAQNCTKYFGNYLHCRIQNPNQQNMLDWDYRVRNIIKNVEILKPDIVCFQELDPVIKGLKEYDSIVDEKSKLGIYFKVDETAKYERPRYFKNLQFNQFKEIPKTNRVIQVALFKSKINEGENLCVVNTHLHHVLETGRLQLLRLIQILHKLHAKYPKMIVCTDLNMDPAVLKSINETLFSNENKDSAGELSIFKSAYKKEENEHNTFFGNNTKRTIDYIFYSKALKAMKILELPKLKDNETMLLPNKQYSSDHIPLYVQFLAL